MTMVSSTRYSTRAIATVKLALLAAAVAAAAALLSVFLSPMSSARLRAGGGGEADREELIPIDAGAVGPESLAFDAAGRGPYTGVSDGRILRWSGAAEGWIQYATVSPSPKVAGTCKGSSVREMEHVCGRPLGLRFNKKGELFVADAYFGLMKVAAGDDAATVVASEAEGIPFRFTNSLDIDDRDGVIYFTDSSARFQRREYMTLIISGDDTGRLMSFDPATGVVRVLVEGLAFANGVALSPDGTYLLVAETSACRVLKYWIHEAPPGRERIEVVAELPGFPDNIRRSPRGGFWVALHTKNGWLIKRVLSSRWLRRALLASGLDLGRLSAVMGRLRGVASAVRVSGEGEVLEASEGFGRRKGVKIISEVEERNGSLWFGSVAMPWVGIYHPQHRH